MPLKKKNKNPKYLLLIISLLIGSITYNMFLFPLQLVTGGINGIATIINQILGIKPSLTLFIESIICVSISLLYLGKERTIGMLFASILYPILVDITSVFKISLQYNIWILIFISSILGGISNGLMYKSGYSNGGLSVLSLILYEKYNYSIAKTSFLINSFIVLAGFYIFGKKTLYAIFYLLIDSFLIEKIASISFKNKKCV